MSHDVQCRCVRLKNHGHYGSLPSLCFATFLPFICIYATSVPPSNATCITSNCGNNFIISPPLQQNHHLRHWIEEPSISYGNRTLYLSNHPYSVRINQPYNSPQIIHLIHIYLFRILKLNLTY